VNCLSALGGSRIRPYSSTASVVYSGHAENPLQIPVNLDPGKVSRFLDCLTAQIRAQGGHRGHGGLRPDGSYEETVELTLHLPNGVTAPVTCQFLVRADNSLAPIDITGPEPTVDWEALVHDLIRDALVCTANQDTYTSPSRSFFCYMGPLLDGEYFLPADGGGTFRIGPAAGQPKIPVFQERVLAVDQLVSGATQNMAYALGQVRSKQYGALLTVFLGLGLYEFKPEHHWVLVPKDGGGFFNQCLQLGYIDPKPLSGGKLERGDLGNPGRSVDANRLPTALRELGRSYQSPEYTQLCPSDLRHLFRAFYSLADPKRRVFLNAAALYQIGRTVGMRYPSVAHAYEIAAVEALKENGASMDSFVRLATRYAPWLPEERWKKVYGEVRSAHFHEGTLPGGEFDPIAFGIAQSKDLLTRLSQTTELALSLHHVLLGWLIEHGKAGYEQHHVL